MANRILAAGLALTLMTSVAVATQQASDLSVRLTAAIDALKGAKVADLISDEVVVYAVSEWSAYVQPTYAAREALYDTTFCPSFGDRIEDFKVCHSATYDVDNTTDPKLWNIPVDAIDPARFLKRAAFEMARDYLANPDNLWNIYVAKKELVLATVDHFDGEQRTEFLDGARSGCAAVALFSNPDARGALDDYMVVDTGFYAAAPTASYDDWTAAREAFRTAVGNPDAFQFVARRHAEGGADLLAMYQKICTDFQGALEAQAL